MSKHDDQAGPTKGKVQVGDLTPDFTLLNQSSGPVSLGDFLGKKHIVLYFYPKNNTSLCTEEACAFRDSYEVFKDAGAEVIGVSSDPVESHRQFAKEHQLPFILLSDVDGVIRKRCKLRLVPGHTVEPEALLSLHPRYGLPMMLERT
jgi:peroxiredoxin Q/BCP